MDTKEILAFVKENNPKQYVKDRFKKDKNPCGDKTCALGAKPSSNRDEKWTMVENGSMSKRHTIIDLCAIQNLNSFAESL